MGAPFTLQPAQQSLAWRSCRPSRPVVPVVPVARLNSIQVPLPSFQAPKLPSSILLHDRGHGLSCPTTAFLLVAAAPRPLTLLPSRFAKPLCCILQPPGPSACYSVCPACLRWGSLPSGINNTTNSLTHGRNHRRQLHLSPAAQPDSTTLTLHWLACLPL